MNPDGIAYLDMGNAYFRGDWTTAIRSHWSPLYAWLVAAVLWLAQPPPNLEFPLVHLANLLMYCLALGAFTFLLRQIVATVRDRDAAAPAHNRSARMGLDSRSATPPSSGASCSTPRSAY